MLKIYIDGASAGNPGKIGIGYVIFKNNSLLKKESIFLGIQTNNFAEYMALIFALTEAVMMGERSCCVFTDSKLLSEQIKGNFRIKSKNILSLFVLAKKLINYFKDFKIIHIKRGENELADSLAKKATGFLI